jgi:hypothetical protein
LWSRPTACAAAVAVRALPYPWLVNGHPDNSPDRLIEEFAEAGANSITIHHEATPHVDRCLRRIRDLGCESGLALNVSTPLSVLDHLYDKLDMLLIMTINPGFGGQSFLPLAFPRIRAAREKLDQIAPAIRVQVDGGVKRSNVAQIVDAGADTIVVGTEIFGSADYSQTIAELRRNALEIPPVCSAQSATDEDFDLACAITSAAEVATTEKGTDERNFAFQIQFFYLGRLSGRDSKTYWSAVVKGKVAELREKAKSPEMYGRCLDFVTKQLWRFHHPITSQR